MLILVEVRELNNLSPNFAPLSHIIRETRFPNLHIVPWHIRLSAADLELAQAFVNLGLCLFPTEKPR
jgi:hypothetical protein